MESRSGLCPAGLFCLPHRHIAIIPIPVRHVLSRVLLAMGRRGDMPRATARLDQKKNSPTVAVLVMGAIVAALVLIGDIHIAWSFSAFTVLLYYGITNLAALQLSDDERYYPRAISWAGLLACFFLAFWVQVWIWMVGIALVALGLLWFQLASHLRDDE